jgi:hypothetical protein
VTGHGRLKGSESAELFANFGANQIKEEDEIEKALDDRRREVKVREEPEVVGAEKKHCRESHGPCPAKEHDQTAAGCEEEDREDQEELWIVSAHGADDEDNGEQKQIERDGGETWKGEEFAPGRRRAFQVCNCGSRFIDCGRFGSGSLVRHKEWR